MWRTCAARNAVLANEKREIEFVTQSGLFEAETKVLKWRIYPIRRMIRDTRR